MGERRDARTLTSRVKQSLWSSVAAASAERSMQAYIRAAAYSSIYAYLA